MPEKEREIRHAFYNCGKLPCPSSLLGCGMRAAELGLILKHQTIVALESARSLLNNGDSSQSAAHALIDESTGVLSGHLDDQVCVFAQRFDCFSWKALVV
jgi:hypothetical protein